jgi:polysaccharide export outer membrane protein
MRLLSTAKVGFVVVLAVTGSVTIWAADPPTPTKSADTVIPPDYRIGAGDVISIEVYKEKEASVGAALVRSDGKVTVPLLDDLYVQGMTTMEVKKEITAKLTPLIPGADVTVRIEKSNSKRVYIDGKVRRVGPLELTGPITVLEAINTAGGFNDFARVDKILINRTENGVTKQIRFDYKAFVKGKVSQNILLQPGDIVIVP